MMKKRLFGILLSVALLCSVLPFSALAYSHTATKPLPSGLYKTWKQTDPRWSNQIIGIDPWTDSMGVRHDEETVGHAGCLISAMAILARAYDLTLTDGTEITPGTLSKAMYDNGSCQYLSYTGAARYDRAFSALIPGISFIGYQEPANPAAKIESLLSDADTEYLIIAGVKKSTHFVAVDYVEDGTVYICDPGYSRTTMADYTISCLLVYSVDEQYVDTGVTLPGEIMWRVIEPDGVRVRDGAGLQYNRIGAYPYGTTFSVSEKAEADGILWGKTADGWCALKMLDDSEIYCEEVQVGTQYSVSYHTNGGSQAPATQYKNADEPLTLSAEVPTKEGYLFLGWSADPSALSADYVAGGVYTEDAAIVLYAVWMAKADIFGYGIDVSSHQGAVDWQAVAQDGIDFVILRAGTSYGKDTRFEENYLGAKAAGLHVGSYIYSYAVTMTEMLEDAAKFTEWLDGKQFDMPVFLDLETKEQARLSKEQLTYMATSFQAVLERAGYYCGVYSSESWYYDFLDPELLGGREHLWVAKWSKSGLLSQNMSVNYSLYQYSETGRVAGINGAVDLDVCYVDFPTMLQSSVVPPPQPPKDVLPLEGSGLQIRDSILTGGKPGGKVADWKALFDGEVLFLDANGKEMTDGQIVATGCSVSCGTKLYTVAVLGDLDGDGKVGPRDYFLLKLGVQMTAELTEVQACAGCLTGGTQPTVRDYWLLKSYVLGLSNLL